MLSLLDGQCPINRQDAILPHIGGMPIRGASDRGGTGGLIGGTRYDRIKE